MVSGFFIFKSFRILSVVALLTLLGCSSGFDQATHQIVLGDQNGPASHDGGHGDDGATGAPTPAPRPPIDIPGSFVLPKIAWETATSASNTATRNWSLHTFRTIMTKGPALLEGASDVEDYCPQYYEIKKEEKAWFWTSLISAMAYYESAWKPTSRMQESTMGTDPVTGNPVYSEGLLQLSYQDQLGHPYCDEFNWTADRLLSPTDPKKTILNPEINLSCGIQILNRQISKYRLIGVSQGAYWAVIKPSKASNKIKQIQARIKNEVSPCFAN